MTYAEFLDNLRYTESLLFALLYLIGLFGLDPIHIPKEPEKPHAPAKPNSDGLIPLDTNLIK